MNRPIAVLTACFLFVCAIAGAAARTDAATPSCPITSYPGDDAAKASIATWMAQGAATAGLPGELPVMAALVESGLTNLHGSDTIGYFQMRVDIWNQGRYAGFPEQPELQLRWFIDHAVLIKSQRIAAGDASFGSDPATWGEWVADVQRPALQYRGRYQLRLAEASALITSTCPGGGPPAGSPPPDTVAPTFKARVKRVQDPIRQGGVAIVVRCPLEDCVAVAEGRVAVGGAAYLRRVRSAPRRVARGGDVRLKLRFERRLIRRIKGALHQRHRARAAVKVTVWDAAGNAASARRKIRLKHGS